MARRHLYNRSATPLELPGTDWGGDPPLRPGMRERERDGLPAFRRSPIQVLTGPGVD